MDKFRTIGPIDTARITVTEVRSQDKSVVSASVLVNAKAFNWKKYLFIQSRLMGKNEDLIRFKDSFVLDIYDLEKSTYLYSLSIPNPGKSVINHLSIIDDHLFLISGNFIYRYKVSLPGTSKTDRLLKAFAT